jgi:hypothetical protein
MASISPSQTPAFHHCSPTPVQRICCRIGNFGIVTVLSEMISEPTPYGTLRISLKVEKPIPLKEVDATCRSDLLSGDASFFSGPIDLRITQSELYEAYDSVPGSCSGRHPLGRVFAASRRRSLSIAQAA